MFVTALLLVLAAFATQAGHIPGDKDVDRPVKDCSPTAILVALGSLAEFEIPKLITQEELVVEIMAEISAGQIIQALTHALELKSQLQELLLHVETVVNDINACL